MSCFLNIQCLSLSRSLRRGLHRSVSEDSSGAETRRIRQDRPASAGDAQRSRRHHVRKRGRHPVKTRTRRHKFDCVNFDVVMIADERPTGRLVQCFGIHFLP